MQIRLSFPTRRQSRSLSVLLLLAFYALILSPSATLSQQPAVQKFTLDQIEGLIVHNVPDATLSNQIRLHGLAFAPSPAILDELSAKGAGPLTLAAIQAFVSKAPQAQPGAPAKQPGGRVKAEVISPLCRHSNSPGRRNLRMGKSR